MCGIAGEIRLGPSEHAADWQHLGQLMAHRGPDQEGFWAEDDYCRLAFRRLAILDLSPAGHQPMCDPSGRYILIFNGELYNYPLLKQELEQRGIQFRSTGDSEVVLQALINWGPAILERFNGMFALALYDQVERRLLLARDHAGIKPLYYLLKPGEGLVFASQYNQLLHHPLSRDCELSQTGLGMYLRLGYIPAPHAILENTFMLEPATWLSIDASGTIKRGRFFEFPRTQPDQLLMGEDADEAVNAVVEQAVRRHLISDVPVGLFLSGGIDSPLVAAKANTISNDMLRAYTIGTSGDVFDESEDAARYATDLKITHVLKHTNGSGIPDMIQSVADACSEPLADRSIFPTFMVSQLASQDVKVVLSGDGGDELFWGYAERFGSVLQHATDFRQPHWWRSIRWGRKKFFNAGSAIWQHRLPSIGEWYKAKHSVQEDRLNRIFLDLPRWIDPHNYFTYDGWQTDETAQWMRWNEFTSHLTRVLLKVDRASMYHSLEVRVPLLDREVIETAYKIDWQSCLDLTTMTGKRPLRSSLARHTSFQTQAKRGFDIPMGKWLKSDLRPLVEDLLLSRPELLGFELNQPALKMMYSQHVAGTADHSHILWSLLSLTLWAERHFQPSRSQ